MSFTIILLTILILLLLSPLFKKLYQNVVLYKRISSEKDFFPTPSWTIGIVWVVLEASFRGYKGLTSFKLVTTRGREEPFSQTGAFWTWIGNPLIGMPLLVPTRTEILKAVLGTKQRVDKGYLYYSINDIFGTGLISSDKVTWNKHRKILNPTFHQQLLHNFVPVMSKESRNLIHEIESRTSKEDFLVNNITTLISHRVMAMLFGTAMGLEDEQLDIEFLETAERFDSVQFLRLQNPIKLIEFFYNKTKEGKDYYSMLQYLRDQSSQLLKKRMEELKTDQNKNISNRKLTLLDTLIEEHLRDPMSMTLRMVEDEFLTFLAAGWDTTTWTASFTLQMIGQHPDVQDQLMMEIESVLSDVSNDDDISMEALSKLKYMECVINETLRMYPLINLTARHIHEDLNVTIDGESRLIPAGTEIIIDSELVHRNPRYWSEPDRFDPDRFMSTADRDPLSFIPFSYGPRNCIGKQFAMIEEKIMISTILRKFRIKSVTPIEEVKMNTSGLARRTLEPLQLYMIPR